MSRQGKLRLAFILALGVMLLAGIIGVTSASLNDPEASTNNTIRTINNWYDLAWHWRKPITISNGGGALSNFQVKITVNTQAMVSAGHMLASGNDIRFTTSDGMTSVPYWIESGINTTSTVIWLKVPAIPAGSSTIYIYYGNTAAAAASSGDNTFIFFDSFETDLSKWTIINPSQGTATRVATPVSNGSYSLSLATTTKNGTYGVSASFTAQTDCIIEYDIRPAQNNSLYAMQVMSASTIGPYLRFNNNGTMQYNDGAWRTFSPSLTYAANTWYSFKLNDVDTGTDTYDFYFNGTLKKSGIAFASALGNVNKIEFVSAANGKPTVYLDNVKVRQYAATEPALSSIGAEE